MSGYDKFGQILALSTNQDRRSFGSFRTEKKKIGSNIYTKSHVLHTTPRKSFITVEKSTPQLQLLGIGEKIKKRGDFIIDTNNMGHV